jgi:hypothetical protein
MRPPWARSWLPNPPLPPGRRRDRVRKMGFALREERGEGVVGRR